MKQVLLGRYKVATWGTEDSDVLDSRMFDELEEAISFGESLGKPYFLMESIFDDNGSYSWRLLDYGGARLWKTGTFLYKHRLAVALFGLACIMRMTK